MTLVLLRPDNQPMLVEREPAGVARREDRLRDMLFAHPEMLPVRAIDPAIGQLIPVATELNVPDVGRIDALLVDERGRLIIVECKLWRNPQARREVVGQILDYARALAQFSYDDLQREVSAATRRSGNVLYELVWQTGANVEEAAFVDQVSRNLASGRMLLLIVGDGITEGTQRIGEFLRDQPGLAFDFGLIEMAQYHVHDPETGADQVIVQPRVLARTVLIERHIITSTLPVAIESVQPVGAPAADARGDRPPSQGTQAWRLFSGRLIEAIRFDDPGQAPPRNGGLGWLRVPLPGPGHLSLWRSEPQATIGAFIAYKGADGLATFDLLAEDQPMIDEEFAIAGLGQIRWTRKSEEASIELNCAAPLPWEAATEQGQIEWFERAANRFVNSFRPRLLALGHMV